MDIIPIYKRVIGLDVHQSQITGCAIIEQPDGSVTYERREFGGFKRDRKALAQWARSMGPDIVVMQSTGIYWKSPYAALESVGIVAWVGNARHVKAVPGRKTDVADAQWLASLASTATCRLPPELTRNFGSTSSAMAALGQEGARLEGGFFHVKLHHHAQQQRRDGCSGLCRDRPARLQRQLRLR